MAAGSAREVRQIPPVAGGDGRVDVPQRIEERIVNDELFGLPLAPFSAVPDVNLFVETPGACEAIHLLTRSLLRDDGIAVLTGEVGVGKTMISKVLADRLSHKLRPLVLSSANFPTRRALYQSVLFSLGQDFVGLTEQEARLLVLDSSREQLSKRGNLVLIIDEAHLLTDRLLEEVRSLISNVDEGRLLVQIVLIGHTSLKERLRDSRFIDLQHRIGCFAHINPMSVDESTDYVRWRLELAGRDAFDVITPGALQLITEIANGYPRCINILCDRAIGLAVESSSPIVDESLVRMGLAELRQLPMVWNEPRSVESANVGEAIHCSTPDNSVVEVRATAGERAHLVPAIAAVESPIEMAADLSPSEEWAAFEIGADWPNDADAIAPPQVIGDLLPQQSETRHGDEYEEIPVFDPYAQFELAQEVVQLHRSDMVSPLPQGSRESVTSESIMHGASASTIDAPLTSRPLAFVDVDHAIEELEDEAPDARWIEEFVEESWPEISVLEAIHELRAGIQVSREQEPLIADTDELEIDYDVVEPETLEAEPHETACEPAVVSFHEAPAVSEQVILAMDTSAGTSVAVNTIETPCAAAPSAATRFAELFTRLKRKRQALAVDSRTER